MRELPTIAICGLGRLGSQLAWHAVKAGLPLTGLITRDSTKADPFNRPAYPHLRDALVHAELFFLTLPDDVIDTKAQELANTDLKGRSFVHCSGSMPSSCLNMLRDAGAQVASFHPLQSFAPLDKGAPNPFANITIGIEGSSALLPLLTTLARKLGATPLEVASTPDARSAYHAAAVIASNALVPLMTLASELMTQAGLPQDKAQHALLPLVEGTLNNLKEHSPTQALTGPVVRGDWQTLKRHLEVIDQEHIQLYTATMRQAASIALEAKRIDQQSYQRIVEVLK